jgi:methylamine dehydrogenase accessory protein MauD
MEKFLLASNIALWIAVILQTLLILALFRYIGLLLDRMPAQGPAVGKSAPRRDVVDIESGKHTLGAPSERHQILIFTSPNCPWCEEMAPHIAPFFSSLGSDYDLLLVLADQPPAGQSNAYARRLGGGAPLKLAIAPELFESYAVPGTPYGLLIDRDGIVRAKGTTNSLTDLQTLVKFPSSKSNQRSVA